MEWKSPNQEATDKMLELELNKNQVVSNVRKGECVCVWGGKGALCTKHSGRGTLNKWQEEIASQLKCLWNGECPGSVFENPKSQQEGSTVNGR